jgi:hypothetical protein
VPRPDAAVMNVTTVTRDAVRALSFTLTGATGRRITMDQAVAAAVAVAVRYPAEAAAVITDADQEAL